MQATDFEKFSADLLKYFGFMLFIPVGKLYFIKFFDHKALTVAMIVSATVLFLIGAISIGFACIIIRRRTVHDSWSIWDNFLVGTPIPYTLNALLVYIQ